MQDNFIRKIKVNNHLEDQSYYFNIPSLCSLKEMDFRKKVTFFVGENGTGKSTLLEAIAVAYGFNGEGGSLNYSFSTKDTHSGLYQYLSFQRGVKKPKDAFFLRAESFYNVATQMEEYNTDGLLEKSYGGKMLHAQSHGESFLSLMQNRFWGNGLYLLDEPEAALSPQNQLTMLMIIEKLVKKNSQFIIASHSPILLGYPDAEIYSFDEKWIHNINYEDTESYRVMELFINNRQEILRHLFKKEY